MGLIRLIVLGFIGLSVLYFLISIYSRSIRREKLEKAWDAKDANLQKEGDMGTRDAYIEDGLAEYESGFRKKLIVLVYVIPPLFVAVILYLTNAQ
ncbi:hypothetical protein [Profundibacter sp.]